MRQPLDNKIGTPPAPAGMTMQPWNLSPVVDPRCRCPLHEAYDPNSQHAPPDQLHQSSDSPDPLSPLITPPDAWPSAREKPSARTLDHRRNICERAASVPERT